MIEHTRRASKAIALRAARLRAVRRLADPLNRTAELAFLSRLLDDLAVDLVFDVGANTGQFGRELRALGYTGWIVSYEPQPAAFQELQNAAARDPRWRAVPLALGTETGEMTMLAPWTGSVFSSLKDFVDGRAATPLRVLVERSGPILETVAAELGCMRPFLKMDTQGFDLEVFRGLGDYRDELVGVLTELSVVHLYEDTLPYHSALGEYAEAGFQPAFFGVVNRVESGSVQELNCTLVRS